jgi:hypothetical protein
MIFVRGRFQAATVAITLASLGTASEPPEDVANSSGAVIRPSRDHHVGHERDGLRMYRPYERGEVPVVLIHGLWGFSQQMSRCR